jgi:exosortase
MAWDYTSMVRSASDQESIATLSPLLVFSVLLASSLAIWWRPMASLFSLALHDDQYTHILLILPISATLIFLGWKSLDWKPRQLSASLSVSLSAVFLLLALVVTAVVRWNVIALPSDLQLSINILALVMWWLAAFVLGFGARAFGQFLFPLCFLFWLVPFPDLLLDPIVTLLQQGSAACAHLLFAAAGVPVAQRGMLLHIPDLTVEVARECSSIRSSLMLVVTTMVLAQLLLRSFWRKALIVAVAIPLSIAKNGLRIFAIAMLATRVDPSFLTGRLHRQGGGIFFLIALIAIFLLLWLAYRGEERQPAVETKKNP